MSDPTLLVDGLAFPESPRWHADRLWFADWGTGEVIAVGPDGGTEVVVRVPSAPLCFDWLPDGRMLLVSGGDGRLLRLEPGGELATHADLGALNTHPWNDIAVDARGNAYVGNIGYDYAAGYPGGDPAPGIIAMITPDGSVRQVADDVAFPNGMVVTPDGGTLIVAESFGRRLTAFDITADGGLANRRVWAELGEDNPDGICLDAENAVWYGDVPHERCVRVAEGGEVLRTITLDRGCFACALGGADGTTLYLVANEFGGAVTSEGKNGQVLAVRL